MSSNYSSSQVYVEEKTNLIGFDPDAVRMSLNKIQTIYNEMVSSFVNYTNTFLSNMSYSWACPEAVGYFRNVFCTEFNSYLVSIDSAVENIFNTINYAARTWSETSGLAYGGVNFGRFPHNSFDASIIRESINGSVGIDGSACQSNMEILNKISNMVNANLNSMINVLRNASFVGNGQQTSLVQSVNSIKNKINESFSDLVVDIKGQINSTIQKYNLTAKTVTSTFSSI